jgi:acetylornithine deacetylase/succinyl-diaminopimelate desuccinylase-like protein
MEPIDILKDLIARPSVNPMGRSVAGPEFFEGRMTEYLVAFFTRLGVPFQRIEVVPGRANVVARLDRLGSNRTILFDAHQDTVPVDGMTISPFDPMERDGRVYGRGACDVKGGMAAMLAAFARLVRERPAGAANVVLSCTCDEESTVLGILDLTQLWSDPARRGSLLETRPDAAVVAEPTELDVVVAHKGVTRWKLRTRGRACHSSSPANGVNAIYRMARVLDCLEEFAKDLPSRVAPHPLCGPPTFSVGRIEGGISVNTVPDECVIEIDRRMIPGEENVDAVAEVIGFLRSRLDFEVEMDPPWSRAPALPDSVNGPCADRLLREVRAVRGRGEKVGVPYGTHASRLAVVGVPSVVFGPGSIAQAHTKDEWIAITELNEAAEIYYGFAAAGG